MIITIDGPAGSGKSTAARQLAKAMGIAYLDTGATYRALTLAALRSGTDLQDQTSLAKLAAEADLRVEQAGDDLRVLLDGRDVSADIRSAEVTDHSHYIARDPAVREVLVSLQRRLGRELERRAGGVVAEGRDQGSVVFAAADMKFYLDAALPVRARRRHEEMVAAGEDVTYDAVLESIVTRDDCDRSRPVAPLVRPAEAIVIDTSEMTIPEVTAKLVQTVREAR